MAFFVRISVCLLNLSSECTCTHKIFTISVLLSEVDAPPVSMLDVWLGLCPRCNTVYLDPLNCCCCCHFLAHSVNLDFCIISEHSDSNLKNLGKSLINTPLWNSWGDNCPARLMSIHNNFCLLFIRKPEIYLINWHTNLINIVNSLLLGSLSNA